MRINHSDPDSVKLVSESYSKGPSSTVVYELSYYYENLGNFSINIFLSHNNRTGFNEALKFSKEFDIKNGMKL